MKRRILLVAALVCAVFALFGVVGISHSQSFQTGDSVNLPKDKVIDGSYYAAGRTLDIAGTVNGDLFCAGQNVTVSGTVHGDVICAGQTLHVSAVVDGNIRAAAQTLTISGPVARNVTAAGQSVSVDDGSKITGDTTLAAGDLSINGSIGRDGLLGGTTITVNGSIGRDVKANVDKLTLNSTAKIGGKVDYTSTKEAIVNPGSVIGGKISRTQPTAHKHRFIVPVAVTFVWGLYMFLSLLLLSLVLALLFPRAFHATSEQGLNHLGRSLLTGAIAFVGAPVLFIALMLTIVGAPLALLFGLAWLLTLLLSGPFFAYYIGRLILPSSKLPVLIMLVGAAIVLALYIVPIVGAMLMFVALIIGSGMIITEAFARVPKPTHPIKPGK